MQLSNHIIRICLFVGVWWLMVERSGAVYSSVCNGYVAYNKETCCAPCNSSTLKNNPCKSKQSRPEECRCDNGYACDSEDCDSCIPLSKCDGDIHRKGDTIYTYICEKKSTVPTIVTVVPTEYTPERTTKNSETKDKVHEITLYLVLVIAILVLLSVIFHIFIWRTKPRPPMKHTDLHKIPQLSVITNPKEDIDTLSCQYPEEEHGEKTLDKDSIHF
ncbi:uncharacterized protein LOC108696518 [Xenopus laevis]|uniref:TNFR-Cys domain-containing protein n=2 Tax=Xenopus laevis TaxID=8355 RepID=A0A974CFW8_XENLA|nr:uncharacterized protein LOC108696518 [Xenopus laevis]OCT72580.1 hypothetical protein XELAEV_18035560mg [Xenopus laevis]